MFKVRRLVAASSAALAMTFGAAPASATGIPVIDIANLAQAISQVMSWADQYQQMVDQYQKAVETVNGVTRVGDSLSGGRGLGSLLRDPRVSAYMPEEITDVARVLSPSRSVTATAAADSVLTAFGLAGTVNQQLAGAAATLNNMQQVLASAGARRNNIQTLSGRVDSTADAKESMDLAGRAGFEAASATGDLAAVIALIEANRSQERLQVARARQLQLDREIAALRAEASDARADYERRMRSL